jgi:hypothetical protein
MSTKSRMSLLSDAFRASPLTFLGEPLRPVTAGTILLLMETGNPLFSDGDKALNESDSLLALFEFIHIHTAPEEEVVADCDTPGALKKKARRLSMRAPLEELQAFSERFGALRTRLEAATAEVMPDANEGKPGAATTPPPTGSLTSSTPSEGRVIPFESATSSGSSPSSAPSNTSTPPTSPMELAPAGVSRTWEPDPTEIPPAEEENSNVIPLP